MTYLKQISHEVKKSRVNYDTTAVRNISNRSNSVIYTLQESGILATHTHIMASKHRYKYEFRRLKHQQLYIRRKRIATALASSSSCNFWKEVRNISRSCSQKVSHAPVVDGIHGDSNIANHFSSKPSGLLSSNCSSQCDKLLDKINSSLSGNYITSVSVSISCVHSAFYLLKPHENADGTNLLSDHLILALPVIEELVANLFTSILYHGYMPSDLRDCILFPFLRVTKIPLPQITIVCSGTSN